MNRPFVRIARAAYIVILIVVVAVIVERNGPTIRSLVGDAEGTFLAAALVSSFGMLVLGARLWLSTLVGLGERTRYAHVLHATARSLPARYIPGSVWFAAGRIALLRRRGVSTAALGYTAVLEIVLTVGTTIGVGGLLLGVAGSLPGGRVWFIPGTAAVLAIATPPILGRLVSALAARRQVMVPKLTAKAYLSSLAWILAFWSWSASTFLLFLRASPISDQIPWTVIAGGFLFSSGIGFIAVFAPQGLGVFEITLAGFLATEGLVEGAIVIGGYRLVILIRDVLATAAAEIAARRIESFEGLDTSHSIE